VASALLVPSAAATPVTVGFRDFSYSTSASAPTADKPQSKLWFHDGRWWGVLFNSVTRRFEIYGFNRGSQDTNAWTSTGTVVDVRRTSQSDARMASTASGPKLYIVTHLKAGSTNADPHLIFKRYGYTAGSAPGTGTYTLERMRNVRNRAVESATVDRDSTGKLWVTWTDDNGPGRRAVFVTHTQATDDDFATPYVLPAVNADNLGGDDISTLVASGGKIGVLYSNQTTGQLQFATHADADPDDRAWTTTTLCATTECPDDHLNIKDLDDSNGQAFAVVKTSLNAPGSAPLIVLYHIDMGTLTAASHTVWTVADNVTRAITVLDKGARDVYVFGAAPCCSGGIVYMKRSAIANPTFAAGLGTPFIQSAQDPKINNPTSTKQSVDGTTGLLVLAGDDSTRFYLHNFLSLGGDGGGGGDTTAPPITATSPADGATGVAVGSNVTATFSEAMDAGTVPGAFTLTAGGSAVSAAVTYDPQANRATLDPAADLVPGTTYTARVSGAKDSAGNTVVAKTWTFTTAAAPSPTGIAREAVSTVVGSTATASITIPKPAGTVAGDVLVACLALNGGRVATGGAPAGWSPIASDAVIANPHIFGYYKVAGSSDPADYRWTLASSVTSGAGIARYSGVNTSTPLDAPASTASGTAASTPIIPGVTTATAGAMLVGCMAMNSSSITNAIGSPSGMTEAWDIGGKRHELADGVQSVAGGSGAKSWTFSAARDWAGWLSALRPD
jgi:Bacterial Ig-like domain